ncbi:PREDICTED: ubiquitin-like protein 3 isoform X1 [Diuraphis noxia]|uniref:ubiquitin-like protein 3 isoform X1 n=1 Tax=Diuraphis noxia TaxID=143948 RepID=UPI00076360E4|nr:PREDICTED: ubiquitin-like protein 3 isoform X1 [Diuraphis noxia]
MVFSYTPKSDKLSVDHNLVVLVSIVNDLNPEELLNTKINLRLILVSGKTKEFIFSPNDSAGDIAQAIFDNWPEDWADEAVEKAEILRLIYQGRFLHSNVTLGALGLVPARTTVMHLVPRETLPEPNSQDQRQKSKGASSSCCSAACSIL